MAERGAWPPPAFTGRLDEAVVSAAYAAAEVVAATEPEAKIIVAYPNPFTEHTTLAFEVEEPGAVRVAVVDMLGREIAVLVAEELVAGRHTVMWTGTDASRQPVAAGLYVVRVATRTSATAQRVTLVR